MLQNGSTGVAACLWISVRSARAWRLCGLLEFPTAAPDGDVDRSARGFPRVEGKPRSPRPHRAALIADDDGPSPSRVGARMD